MVEEDPLLTVLKLKTKKTNLNLSLNLFPIIYLKIVNFGLHTLGARGFFFFSRRRAREEGKKLWSRPVRTSLP